jgi:GAF domain-containing protein
VSAGEIVLLAIAGWTAVSVVTLLAVQPLLRVAHLGDLAARDGLRRRRAGSGESRQSELRAPSPRLRESGYLGIVLERLVLHACTIFAADQVCVFGRDTRARGGGLVLVQGAGVSPELIGRPLDVDWDAMVAALACGRPLAVSGDLWPSWEPGDEGSPVHSAAIAPVWFGGRLQGALAITHRGHFPPLDAHGLDRLGDVAELVGQALAHAAGRQLSAADPQPEIDGLLDALERTAPESARLGAAVATVARVVGEDLGIGGTDLLEVGLGARLHALGRLRMPAAEPGQELLPLEPVWGAEMVAGIPGLEAVALVVRHSRERWDGLGHPDGLAGERIPLASRIIAVSEAVCSVSRAVVSELAGASLDPDLAARAASLMPSARAPADRVETTGGI